MRSRRASSHLSGPAQGAHLRIAAIVIPLIGERDNHDLPRSDQRALMQPPS